MLFCNAKLNVPRSLYRVEKPKRTEPFLADHARQNLPKAVKFDPALYDFCSSAYRLPCCPSPALTSSPPPVHHFRENS